MGGGGGGGRRGEGNITLHVLGEDGSVEQCQVERQVSYIVVALCHLP